jgi:hypothetical protein
VLHPQLSHAVDVAARSGSEAVSDGRTASVLVALLALWLLYLTVSLLLDVFRLLVGIKLMIAAAFLVGVPLAAVLLAASKLL